MSLQLRHVASEWWVKSVLNFLCILSAKMAEELSRKWRQRGGHRSPATRIILSVIKVLITGDISQFAEHTVKLNQQRASLHHKQITVQQLDTEILALKGEDEIKAEVERADVVKEYIQLSITNIDNALSSNANVNTVASNQSVQLPLQPSMLANTLTEESHGENDSPPRATLVDSSASSLGKTQVRLPKLELKKS